MLNEEQDYDDKMVVAMLRLDLLTAEESLDVAMFLNGMDQYLACGRTYLSLTSVKFSIDSSVLCMSPAQPSIRT